MPETIQLCAIQLPGRETRFAEPLIDQMDRMVDRLAEELATEVELPYVVYGHSMGARIGFELVRAFRRLGLPQPAHLFVGACDAPSRARPPRQGLMLHEAPDAVLISHLADFGGAARAVFDNAELMNLLLPIYRADLALNERYLFTEEPPLDCPITAFGGCNDRNVSMGALEDWRLQTRADFELCMVEGAHFFLKDAVGSFLPMLLDRIARLYKHA
jgi:medium-chain acyl-[acyl-carrier-protein] hydrolase